MSEEWRAIAGSEGFYEVSDLGRVRSLDRWFIRSDGRRQFTRGRVLKPKLRGEKRNYSAVTLRFGATRNVHVLVCVAFHGPRPGEGWEAAHGNGDSTDNRAANLRWATRSENQHDSMRHGTKHGFRKGQHVGSDNFPAKLTELEVLEIRRLYAAGGYSHRALAARYAVGKSQIANIVTGKRWRHLLSPA